MFRSLAVGGGDTGITQQRPPRILEVLYSYRMGGSEILASRLSKALAARGYDVETCSLHTEKGVISDELEQSGIPCTAFDLEHSARWQKLLFPLRLFWFLKTRRVDIMHVHHIFVLRHCYRAARLAGVKRIVVTEHSDHEFRDHAGLRRDGHYFGNAADAVTVIHNGMRRYFASQLAVADEKIKLVYNSVDTETFRPAPRDHRLHNEFDIPAEAVVCGWAGRFHEAKDIGTLLRAFSIVSQHCERPAVLVMVGDGEDRPLAESLIESLGLRDRVFLTGARADIPELMREFDLYVSSSYKEGVPLVLLEAMATGLPCIATDVGGVADVVGEEAGVVVPAQAPDLLARALQSLIEDDEARRSKGKAALARASQRYRFEGMVERFVEVLQLQQSVSTES